ncbi:MAG: hypothetical protein KGM44_11105 [bacterium]|nr:hypothetical protein [bacterium]
MASIRRGIGAAPPALGPGEDFRPFALEPCRVEAEEIPPAEQVATISPESRESMAVAGEALRFRAALREAFAQRLQTICTDLAARVLARELRLEPADVASLAQELLEHRGDEAALALRAAPEDAAALRALAAEHGLALRIDAKLLGGDVALDLRSGALESTLALRLQTLLAACAGVA